MELSEILQVLAGSGANILTIHQSIPLNGIAGLSVSMQISEMSEGAGIISSLEKTAGVRKVRITGRA